eukprot:1891654-Heterocapsa_arctica.AAC.1
MQLLEREIAGEVRMSSQRESGEAPLCLVPTPSLATSPSSKFGSKYSPKESWLTMLMLGTVEGPPPA